MLKQNIKAGIIRFFTATSSSRIDDVTQFVRLFFCSHIFLAALKVHLHFALKEDFTPKEHFELKDYFVLKEDFAQKGNFAQKETFVIEETLHLKRALYQKSSL